MEIWKAIPGFGGRYEVSSEGRVRLIKLVRQHTTWRDGYPTVTLSCDDGGVKTFTVHSLVAEAFIGPRPAGQVVRHWNDEKLDNRAENLRWGTHGENDADARRNRKKRTKNGPDAPRAKLTAVDVSCIRQLLDTTSQAAIAKQFGVDQSAISRIKRGESYPEVRP